MRRGSDSPAPAGEGHRKTILVLTLALILTFSPGEKGQLRSSQFLSSVSRESNVWAKRGVSAPNLTARDR